MTNFVSITVPSNPTNLAALMSAWKTNIVNAPLPGQGCGRYLTPPEISAFLLAASGDEDPLCGVVLSCSLLSGIPPLDLATASWHPIEPGTIVLGHPDDDDCTFHRLSAAAMSLLELAGLDGEQAPLVFFYDEVDGYGSIEVDELIDAFERIVERANIPHLDVNDLILTFNYIALVEALLNP